MLSHSLMNDYKHLLDDYIKHTNPPRKKWGCQVKYLVNHIHHFHFSGATGPARHIAYEMLYTDYLPQVNKMDAIPFLKAVYRLAFQYYSADQSSELSRILLNFVCLNLPNLPLLPNASEKDNKKLLEYYTTLHEKYFATEEYKPITTMRN